MEEKQTKKRIITVLIILALAFVPLPSTYKDGGTKTYTSLTYKYIKWNRMRAPYEEDYTGTSIYFFPKNFLPLGMLYEMETNGR